MQKTNFIFAFIAFLGTCFYAQAQFSGLGTGAIDSPYQITNATQLNEMRNYLGETGSNKHFQLMNDIDLSAYIALEDPVLGWEPIGNSPDDAGSFHGYLHGGNFTISNLWIDRGSDDNVGLFGYIKDGGVDHVTILLDQLGVSGHNNIGGLAGAVSAATVGNVNVQGTITAVENGGGLIGLVNDDSVIQDNTASVTITATGNNIGGLVGSASSPILNCTSSGTISTAGDSIGGLVGNALAAVSNSSSTADVSNTGGFFVGNFMGGLVGAAKSTVTNCSASGTVSGTNVVGGLVGDSYGLISDSHASGQVNGNATVGGFIGATDSVENCYATGAVIADQNMVGGLAGQSYGTINKSYSTGPVSGAKSVGGLVGMGYMDVSYSYSASNVTGTIPENIPEGGLIDYGGLIGDAFGSVTNCYATGSIYAPENSMYVGGLIGISSGLVTKCYASGSVLTDSYSMIGGLIGDAWASVSGCVAANPSIKGAATGNLNNIHRLVGLLEFDATVSTSYALQTMRVNGSNAITGTEDSMHGLNKTAVELQAQLTYEGNPDWDFNEIWTIREGHGYPYFGWKEYYSSIISSGVNDELQGSITPVGDVAVEDGSDTLYTITPAEDYEIDHVTVDGENVGSEPTYLFSDVAANHTIEVLFKAINMGTGDVDLLPVNVYPNPTRDIVTISYSQGVSGISVFNLSGQLVLTQSTDIDHTQVDLSKLSSGTYLVKIASGHKMKTVKVVKL